MPYATQSDLVSRFGETEIIQLSDRINAGVIDAAVVVDKLADADAEIDAYLGQRYTLPLANVPPVLVRVACDIARYHLFDDRATEDVIRRYTWCVKFLENLAKGVVTLGPDPGGVTPISSDLPDHVSEAPTFNRRILGDFLG